MEEPKDFTLADAVAACDGWYRVSRHLVNCLNPECDVRRKAGLGMAVSDLTFEGYDVDVYEGCIWPELPLNPFSGIDMENPF